jgi:superfamily II DNA helicase RecQ
MPFHLEQCLERLVLTRILDVSHSFRAVNPAPARVGFGVQVGGYDFTVREVNLDGVVVSTGDSRTTTLPFGWKFSVGAQTRTLIDPSVAKPRRSAFGPSKDADPHLHNALKAWRLDQARADGDPAFVIFNDHTLDELSSVQPRTVGELPGIYGVGPARVDR